MSDNSVSILRRPRRNRSQSRLRDGLKESSVRPAHLVQPLFVAKETANIVSMPGQKRFSLEDLAQEVQELESLGLMGVCLFPALDDDLKDRVGSEGVRPGNLLCKAIALVKEKAPGLVVFTDVALDPYSSDGHDGVVRDGEIKNDETLDILAQMSVLHAQAGADFVAPSDMMDGRVESIRLALDDAGFCDVGILSYTAKYASALYGPFRDALDSAPKFGDKKTYQMDPANSKEALLELELDINEGADMVMVKPGSYYQDIVYSLSQNSPVPVAVYQVSGEYSMQCAAIEKGWLEKVSLITESLLSLRRSGASIIFTYWAKEFSKAFK